MTVSINGTSGLIFNDASTQNNYHDIFEYKDGKLFWKQTKRVDLIGKEISGVNGDGYIRIKVNGKTKKTHQVIYQMFYGYIPSVIDHINGIKTDNRIENLREVTRSQNSMNHSIKRHGKQRNVSWHIRVQKWNVRVMKNYKTVYSAYFEDKELADLVAFEARKKFFKQYARSEPCL
jgi:hypothetical protein